MPVELTYEPDSPAPGPSSRVQGPRPTIGVTMPDRGDGLAWLALKLAVWTAGGRAVMLTAQAPRDPQSIDGLIFGGGSDVYPMAFEGQPKFGYRYDLARGDMEASWGLAARRRDLPVLGIRRGAQMLNVLAGGTLHMDLSTFDGADLTPTAWEHLAERKLVAPRPGSRLAAIVGSDRLSVNSIHQQAIDRLGVGLTVAARESNGIVQAVEDQGRLFWIGVQYHPELLIHDRRHRALFRGLVEAASAARVARIPGMA